MDEVWQQLPYDLIEHIADLTDIDTRRAMGFKPRRLPPSDFNPKPMPPVEYRYYINEKKLWYFEIFEYGNFYLDITTGVELVNPIIPLFRYMDYARQRIITHNDLVNHYEEFQVTAPSWQTFRTAGHPIFIETSSK